MQKCSKINEVFKNKKSLDQKRIDKAKKVVKNCQKCPNLAKFAIFTYTAPLRPKQKIFKKYFFEKMFWQILHLLNTWIVIIRQILADLTLTEVMVILKFQPSYFEIWLEKLQIGQNLHFIAAKKSISR